MTVHTQEALASCLRDAQARREERAILTIGRPLAAEINRQRLINLLELLLPQCQGSGQVIRRERDGSWYLNLRLYYRTGLRMADAWAAGDLSPLSETERQALAAAGAIAREICEAQKDEEARARAIMARLHTLAVYENPPRGTLAHGRVVSALSVLREGRANCQGFSDAFYLLATLCGLKAEYRLGFKGREMHLWNGVELSGAWQAVDATAGALGAEESLGLIRAMEANFLSSGLNAPAKS